MPCFPPKNVQIRMQHCCTLADENEPAVRYSASRPGERTQVGVSTWCHEPATNLTQDVFRHSRLSLPAVGSTQRKILRLRNVRFVWSRSQT